MPSTPAGLFSVKILIPLILLLIAGVICFFVYKPTGFQNSAVVKTGSIREFVIASGVVDARREADLSFKNTGKIVFLPVSKNDLVKQGQVVAKLDTKELELVLDRAYSDLRNYKAIVDYVHDNVKNHDKDEDFNTRQTRTTAEVNYDKAASAVRSAQKSLDDASLVAPFDAEVVEVNAQVNEWVSAFTTLPQVKLVDFSGVHFLADVDQKNISHVSIGQKVVVRLDAYTNKEFDGVVSQVSKITKAGSGGGVVVEVKIDFDNKTDNLIVGLEGDAEIIKQEKQGVLLVPKAAVFRKESQYFVHTEKGDRVVNLGIFDGVNWEVLDGLREGEKVVW